MKRAGAGLRQLHEEWSKKGGVSNGRNALLLCRCTPLCRLIQGLYRQHVTRVCRQGRECATRIPEEVNKEESVSAGGRGGVSLCWRKRRSQSLLERQCHRRKRSREQRWGGEGDSERERQGETGDSSAKAPACKRGVKRAHALSVSIYTYL